MLRSALEAMEGSAVVEAGVLNPATEDAPADGAAVEGAVAEGAAAEGAAAENAAAEGAAADGAAAEHVTGEVAAADFTAAEGSAVEGAASEDAAVEVAAVDGDVEGAAAGGAGRVEIDTAVEGAAVEGAVVLPLLSGFYLDASAVGARAFVGREVPSATVGGPVASFVDIPDPGGDAVPTLSVALGTLQGDGDEGAAALLELRQNFAAAVRQSLTIVAGEQALHVVVGVSDPIGAGDSEVLYGVWEQVRQAAQEVCPNSAFQVLPPAGKGDACLAVYELRAAAYLARKALDLPLDCVLSLSDASLRCACAPQHNIDKGSAKAARSVTLLLKEGEGLIAQGEEGVAAWEKKCEDACSEQLASFATWFSGADPKERPTQDTVDAQSLVNEASRVRLMAIGVGEQVAVAAGLLAAPGDTTKAHSLVAVLSALSKFANDDSAVARLRAAAFALAAALTTLLPAAVGGDATRGGELRERCEVLFGDVLQTGGDSFRASWAAGHFLSLLPEDAVAAASPKADAAVHGAAQNQDADVELPGASAEQADSADAAAAGESADSAAQAVAEPAQRGDAALDGAGDVDLDGADGAVPVFEAGLSREASFAASAGGLEAGADLMRTSVEAVAAPSPQHANAAVRGSAADASNTSAAVAPGLVIYVLSPAAAAPDETALCAEEYRAVTAAALRSGAAVVLGVPTAASVAVVDAAAEIQRRVFRPLANFAEARFRRPGGSAQDALTNLFQALDAADSGGMGAHEVARGLRSLGYPGDGPVAAEALLSAAGTVGRLEQEDFCRLLSEAAARPALSIICPSERPDGRESSEAWHDANLIAAGAPDVFDLGSDAVLTAKTSEALRLAGRGANAYGVVLVLAARARAALPPAEYERLMRSELSAVSRLLPASWPMLWSPAPAEVGLLPPGGLRTLMELPKDAGEQELLGWLRYVFYARPLAPAG